jgi:hypothetical protein
VAAIAVGSKYPHAIVLLQVSYTRSKLKAQANQPENHLVALGHGSHDKDDHRDEEKNKKAEINRQQKTPAHTYEKGHVWHSQKHGRASAAAE